MPNGREYARASYDYLKAHPGIPYVTNGVPPKGADCQSWVEFCLSLLGIKRNWRGSNDMWRHALSWKGTPEECRAKFGKVPDGALVFILKFDGGEKQRGYDDNEGNASHVGVVTNIGDGATHASSSRNCVCESKFAGKTIPNGGWNRVGLLKDLSYDGSGGDDPGPDEKGDDFVKAFVNTDATGGGTLNLRDRPHETGNRITKIPNGSEVDAAEYNTSWAEVRWNGYSGYAMKKFISSVPGGGSYDPAPGGDTPDPGSLDDIKRAVKDLVEACRNAGWDV